VVRDAPLTQSLSALGAFRVELAFADAEGASRAADGLRARGLARVGATRFQGLFGSARKLEVVRELVATYGQTLSDFTVLDTESLDDAAPAARRTGNE
jgi:hypothetical protein